MTHYWLKSVCHSLYFLKPEYRAKERCRSLVFFQNTWINISQSNQCCLSGTLLTLKADTFFCWRFRSFGIFDLIINILYVVPYAGLCCAVALLVACYIASVLCSADLFVAQKGNIRKNEQPLSWSSNTFILRVIIQLCTVLSAASWKLGLCCRSFGSRGFHHCSVRKLWQRVQQDLSVSSSLPSSSLLSPFCKITVHAGSH